MARRKADPKKAEEKAAKTEALVAALKNRAATFRESDGAFLRLVQMSAKFHRYSLTNQFLIMAQRPDVTAVNSYKRWQEVGRQVRKGESGIYIRAPRPYKGKNLKGEEEEHVAFVWVPVFGYEQTDAIEGFEGTPWAPFVFPTLTDEVGEDYVTGMLRHLEDEGVAIELFTDKRSYRGRFVIPDDGEKPEIKLDVTMPMLQQLNTLVHEVGHYEHWRKEPHTLKTFGKPAVEFIAEASSYAVLHELGFDTSLKSVAYIAVQRATNDDADKEAVVMKLVVEIVGRIMERFEAIAGAESPAVGDEVAA